MAARAISAQLRQEERPGHMGAPLWSAPSLPRGLPGVTALNTLTVLPGQGGKKERCQEGRKKNIAGENLTFVSSPKATGTL